MRGPPAFFPSLRSGPGNDARRRRSVLCRVTPGFELQFGRVCLRPALTVASLLQQKSEVLRTGVLSARPPTPGEGSHQRALQGRALYFSFCLQRHVPILSACLPLSSTNAYMRHCLVRSQGDRPSGGVLRAVFCSVRICARSILPGENFSPGRFSRIQPSPIERLKKIRPPWGRAYVTGRAPGLRDAPRIPGVAYCRP